MRNETEHTFTPPTLFSCLAPPTGVHLGDNVIASADIEEVVGDADLLVFASPHQYMHSIIRKLAGKVRPGLLCLK